MMMMVAMMAGVELLDPESGCGSGRSTRLQSSLHPDAQFQVTVHVAHNINNLLLGADPVQQQGQVGGSRGQHMYSQEGQQVRMSGVHSCGHDG